MRFLLGVLVKKFFERMVETANCSSCHITMKMIMTSLIKSNFDGHSVRMIVCYPADLKVSESHVTHRNGGKKFWFKNLNPKFAKERLLV